MNLSARIAGPGKMEGGTQFSSFLDQIGLAQMNEGTVQAQFFSVRQTQGRFHGISKFGPAVRINRMVAGMGRVSNCVKPDG